MSRLLPIALLSLALSVCLAGEAPKPETPAAPEKPEKPAEPAKLEPGTYAHIATAKGEIVVRLLVEKAPETTENFIELAKGERPFKDKDGRWVRRPFYNGLTFHRVEDGELKLIQGGCPLGDGTGGPGYRFDDELDDALTFDEPGAVAMANSGRNTNGSQFFITCAPAEALNKRFTVFGTVVRGLDVVEAISKLPATAKGRGRSAIHMADEPVVMKAVTIEVVEPATPPEPAKKD